MWPEKIAQIRRGAKSHNDTLKPKNTVEPHESIPEVWAKNPHYVESLPTATSRSWLAPEVGLLRI